MYDVMKIDELISLKRDYKHGFKFLARFFLLKILDEVECKVVGKRTVWILPLLKSGNLASLSYERNISFLTNRPNSFTSLKRNYSF